MRVIELVRLGKRYLVSGMLIAIVFIGLFLAGYFMVYKKLLHGTKKIAFRRVLLWGILLCYLVVVFGVTLLSRGSLWEQKKVQPLFYSYREAWVNWSAAAWRNIILNYCMFIPLGIILPTGWKLFRSFWKTSLAGLSLTVCIELAQLLLQRGIFELDDLWGNTFGTLSGYGLFLLGSQLFCIIKRRERIGWKRVILAQIPLAAMTALFCVIFSVYRLQDLGNNPNSYLPDYDKKQIHVIHDIPLQEEDKLTVYKAVSLSQQEAIDKGAALLENLGTSIDEGRTDIYDNTIVLYSTEGQYSLWINYKGGTYRLTAFNIRYPDHVAAEPISGADEQTIRKQIGALGITVPEDASFTDQGNGSYLFEAKMAVCADELVNGQLTCQYFGEAGIGILENDFVTCVPYKDYPVISEGEALQQIADGKFQTQYFQDEILDIRIEGIDVKYEIDSKSFYQPNYRFQCTINGQETAILLPAIQ